MYTNQRTECGLIKEMMRTNQRTKCRLTKEINVDLPKN